MEEENIDNIFREKLKDKDVIPVQVKWDSNSGWKALEKVIPQVVPYQRNWKRFAAIAAVILVSFCCGYFIQRILSSKTTFSSEADNSIKKIALPGGCSCTLAPYSKIQFTQAKSKSIPDTLYIEGEAYIESPENRLLIVKAKNSITSCRGAIMNIRANSSEKATVISTISGEVTARCTDNRFTALTVAPSEQFTVLESGILSFKSNNSDPNFLAWKTGTLTFNNMPLEYAVKVLEDYYGVCISIEKEEIKYCRITSQFKNLSLKEALHDIEFRLNLKVQQKGLMYILEGKGC
jgi:transmembrane sensor